MLGKMTANQENMKTLMNAVQENIKTLMAANQENMKTLVEEYKNHSTEHFKQLEEKQDKHNNLIERMAVVEQSSKSAHKRSDQIEKHIEKIEEHLVTWNE